jgi:hypothetical protein
MKWLRRLLGLCTHDDVVTHFRGMYTRGVVCSWCGHAELRDEWNDGTEPVGWWIE